MQDIEKLSPELQNILSQPIRELGLKLEESPVHRYVQQLYRELDRKGVKKFRPQCYLTDEWGCPSGEPVIGIPFYLAHTDLARLERELNDLETTREIMMYLRHEAGHAFNYAYKLYNTPEWKQLFGPFRRPYRDNYRPIPFSRNYVRHLAGWYAQKHPDEDFRGNFCGLADAPIRLEKTLSRLGSDGKVAIHGSDRTRTWRCRRDTTSRPNGRDG